MFTAQHWQQPWLGVYIMNFCKSSQQGWFSGNANMLKSGGEKEEGENKDNSQCFLGERSDLYLLTGGIAQNTSALI